MKCNNVQKLILEARPDELNPGQLSEIEKHVAGCRECRNLREAVADADRTLEKLKAAIPWLQNENTIPDSVVRAIRKNDASHGYNLLDRLTIIFQLRAVRFACAFVILLCAGSFMVIESRDMEQIVGLERRIGKQTEIGRAELSMVRERDLQRLYDIYRFSAGDKSIAELSDELVLVKKKDLQMLLEISDRLAPGELEQLSRIRDRNELKSEIDRLKSEFDQHRRKP